MWELDHKERWTPKNWCFWTVVFNKTLKSPLDCKEIKPVNPKGNQSSIFIGRTQYEAEAPTLWPSDVKNWLIGKYSDAGKDWRQEEKGTIRGWDGRMALPTQWTRVCTNWGRYGRTGKLGMLQSMGSQRVRRDLRDWTTRQPHIQTTSALKKHSFPCYSGPSWATEEPKDKMLLLKRSLTGEKMS